MASPTHTIEPTEPLSWGRLGAWLLCCILFWLVVGTLLDYYTPEPAPAELPVRGTAFVPSDTTTP